MMETFMQVRLRLYAMILQKRYCTRSKFIAYVVEMVLTLRIVSTPSGKGTNGACLPLPALASATH